MVAKKRKIKKSGKFKNIFFSVLLGVFLFGLVSFLVISNLRIIKKRAELTEKIEEIKKEIRFLEERNEQLKAGILQTESDAYWEAKLYEQGFKKPGEEAIVVLPPLSEEKKELKEEKNILEKWLEAIGF